nr:iron ABC transporter permease [Streptomyces sp. NBRC 109706]
MACGLMLGSEFIGPRTVWQALTGAEDTLQHVRVSGIRLPRLALAMTVGAALATAGALMQAVTRNPLADPGILGVNAGACLAVVTAILVFGVGTPAGYVWFAFAGAALAAVAVYGVGAAGTGGMTPVKVTLAGAVLAALFSSVTSTILVLDQRSLDQMRFWMVGSLAGRGLDVLWPVLPHVLLGLVVALSSGRAVNVLVLGEEQARALGLRVARLRLLLAAAVVLLAGGAVALAGPIGFVGLVVPHMARLVTGNDYRWLLGYCALYGAALMVAADIAARTLLAPREILVGVCTAVVGAPVFLLLARRRRLVAT